MSEYPIYRELRNFGSGISLHVTITKKDVAPGNSGFGKSVADRYWIKTTEGLHVFNSISPSESDMIRRRAETWAAIMYQTGRRSMTENTETVPIDVATEGQAFIVAYVFAVHDRPPRQIAAQFEVSVETIEQYIRDVIGLRR